jgi:predicted PurR-regulated permease PerM
MEIKNTAPEPLPQPLNEPAMSPRWGSTLKLIVGLTFAAIIFALFLYFRQILGPLLIAFVITFLLRPAIEWISRTTRFSWKITVNLVFLLLIIVLIFLFTLTGLAVFSQIQNLIKEVETLVATLPKSIADLSKQVIVFGPLSIDLSTLDLAVLSERLLSSVQPLIERLGNLFGTFATSTVSFLGWVAFILIISYFILVDAKKVSGSFLNVDIPGHNADIRRLRLELNLIWNAYIRGQFLIFTMAVGAYTILMSILGVRYAFAIAIMAGLARFVPYLGPAITWTTTALVAFLQGGNYFGLQQVQFTILVIVSAMVVDSIFDNFVSPRIFGASLGVHPAAVLVAAIVAANWIGLVGILLAAPVLATLTLLSRYALRKLLDLDPWPLQTVEVIEPKPKPVLPSVIQLQNWLKNLRRSVK